MIIILFKDAKIKNGATFESVQSREFLILNPSI